MKRINAQAALIILLAFALLFTPLTGDAQTAPKGPADWDVEKGKVVKQTEKGLFNISLSIAGVEPVVGTNSANLMIKDKNGKPLTGAELGVIPWLPAGGHGVWDKPTVVERGGGTYRVDNIVFARSGQWDLRVSVKRGAEEDRAVFSFSVGSGTRTSQEAPQRSKRRYIRTVEAYAVPNVTLLNQDGKKLRLGSFIDSGKPVVIDFIYTTCTTICPVLSAGFASLRSKLGKDAAAVQLISISIDPENDRPEQMKAYLNKFGAGEGWDFVTGNREDIAIVLKALDAEIPDKMAHRPIYLIRGSKTDQWVRINGLVSGADLMEELRRVETRGVNEPIMTH